MNENKALLYQYSQAAEVIKTAILLDSSSTLYASNSTIAIVDMEDLINESAINNTLQICQKTYAMHYPI